MKFEGSGSKGTRVIERKRSVTDGQGKNNMSTPEGGDIIISRTKNSGSQQKSSQQQLFRKAINGG